MFGRRGGKCHPGRDCARRGGPCKTGAVQRAAPGPEMGPKKWTRMNMKRNIQFALKPRSHNGKQVIDNLPIRMWGSFNSERVDILTGYSIDANKWDVDSQRVRMDDNLT